ncbi:hypothetical protein FSP39_018233 [Pinctada imbricata]|uniref:B box-type domain-containing protein n=1 Tax=Pinctada imbricata TaxID=66713 RepID=A0AA88Y0M9_PINIB|nr:hypothetical protein FSP39_018233 [Pinctada imbricata]
MSLSKSANFEHAQATIQCDHCGGVDDVKHYCLICEETMCPTCKAIHNKGRATRDHQVVLRQERDTQEQTSTFCPKHQNQITSSHCYTCNVPVCTKCIAETIHNGHKFSDVSKILENLKQELRDSKKKMETRLKEVNDMIQKGDKNWREYENKAKGIESSISHDAVSLRSLVDKMEVNRKEELKSIKCQDSKTWEAVKSLLDEEKIMISRNLAKHDKCLSSTTISGMAELLNESKEQRSKLLNPIEVVSLSYQLPSNTSIEGIGEICRTSEVQPMIHGRNLHIGRAVVMSSFSFTLGIPSICNAGNGNVLIGYRESNDIVTVNTKEGKIVHKRKNVLRNKCLSLAVTASEDILVSPIKGHCMFVLNGPNKLSTLFDTTPYETLFISVTETQEQLICLRKSVNGRYKGRVILCDGEGSNQKHIGSDDFYESPVQAVALQDGGFCISDLGKQQLMVLNTDGNIRHTIQNPLGRERFWPRGICTDKFGNILATDLLNHCVYFIEKDMSVRELVGVREGIRKPRCMCIDDDNYLWLAQYNGDIKVIKYLEEESLL